MKKVLLVFLILQTHGVNAHENKIDSLKKILIAEIKDTSRINALAELGKSYLYSDPDSGLMFLQKGLALAREKGFKRGEARCLSHLGSASFFIGNAPKALEFFLDALKIYENIGDMQGVGSVFLGIGSVYSLQGDEKRSIAFTFRSSKVFESTNNRDGLISTFTNIGDSYLNLNQLDSALIYSNKALGLCSQYKQEQYGLILANLGLIHFKMLHYQSALVYYHKAIPQLESTKNLMGLCGAYLGVAELFVERGQADSALFYSRFSLKTAQNGSFTKQVLDASTFLTNYYKNKRLIDSAFYYQQITITAKDSLFSKEKVMAIQRLSFQEQVRQQEIAYANRLAELKRKSNAQMMGIGTFISFFFGILFISGKRRKSPKIVKFLGLLGILLLFEFISMILSPYISTLTNNIPILMLLVLVGVASILIPLHNGLENLVLIKLARRIPDIQ